MGQRAQQRRGMGTIVTTLALGVSAQAATTVQIGGSGKTYASSAVQCMADAATHQWFPTVEAGLFNPRHTAKAGVTLDGAFQATVTADLPSVTLHLATGDHTLVVAPTKRTADTYRYAVPAGLCTLPDTSGNWISADGVLEYAASGKSYATVVPGCALNPASGQAQPFVNLFDNGGYLLNVSNNGVPLTQLSATRPHAPVFLVPGLNVISAANGSLSIDYYVRDGGSGSCQLP